MSMLDQLEESKRHFGGPDQGRLERLLRSIARHRFRDAQSLIWLHENLLFLRAYPSSPRVARLVDRILFTFADRIALLRTAGADLAPFEEPDVSGIAGTSLSAVFSYEVARQLAARYPRSLEIAWDRCDEPEKLGPSIRRFVPLLTEDWPVEANVPYREWLEAARLMQPSDLALLLERFARLPISALDRAGLFEAIDLPLVWRIGDRVSRSRLRLPGGTIHFHPEPLLKRSDVSILHELEGPPLPVHRVPQPEAGKILDMILDTSAMRYRELYGFTHPDVTRVFRAELGRGVTIFFFGVPSEWRLPLRAYHAGLFFKNGVPAGYVETLSMFERAEVGFNMYYTFREGESAWIYARVLRLLRQMLGVRCFSVDPYQLGHENSEAIASGAFWFYRKLGFRPVDRDVVRLTEREEARMLRTPRHRSSEQTLKNLARGYLLFEGPGCEPGAWDRFRARNLGFAVERAIARRFGGDPERMMRAVERQMKDTLGYARPHPLMLVLSLTPELSRWTRQEKLALAEILRAKQGRDETRYLRLMQRHARLRSALLKLGSSG